MVGIITKIKAKYNKWANENVNVDEILELDKADFQKKISEAREKVVKLTTERNKLEITHNEFEGRIYKATTKAKKAAEAGNEEEARIALKKKKTLEAQRDGLAATIKSLKEKEEFLKDKVQGMQESLEMLEADNIVLKANLRAAEVSKDAAEMLTGMGADDNDFNKVREIADDKTNEFNAKAKSINDLADEGFLKAREYGKVTIDDDEVEAELAELMKTKK